jgi:hypothetical protein
MLPVHPFRQILGPLLRVHLLEERALFRNQMANDESAADLPRVIEARGQ